MTVTLYIDTDANLAAMLPAGIRFAVVHGDRVRVVVATGRVKAGVFEELPSEALLVGTAQPELEEPAASYAAVLRAALDSELGADGWQVEPADEQSGADGETLAPSTAPHFQLCVTGLGSNLRIWLPASESGPGDTLVAVQQRVEKETAESSERRRQILSDSTCEVVMVRPGSGADSDRAGVLLAVGRGPHARLAMKLAEKLEETGGGPVEALIVQPDIGPDSFGVGRRTLAQLLQRAIGDASRKFSFRVSINDHRHVGILERYQEGKTALVLLGATKRGGLGQRMRGTISQRILRGTAEPTVIITRAPVPLSGRAQRLLAAWFQRRVPQLERESRLALVERVQSNSQWDFDFVILMSLATLIAAAGLIVNSAAVIIGAMLVAPLMVPIMGVGMALVQGNPRLIRMAFRSVGLGFLTAFLLSVGLGFLQPELVEPTSEMLGRNWPGTLDLFVAFVAGLAGVYSSSRPNLVAALPGVAIAAALVPPIATAGVALSMGEYSLSLGASLLFLTNFVAIVLASSAGLWVVGMRHSLSGSRLTRVSGGIISFVAIVMAFALAWTPSRYKVALQPPVVLQERFERQLGTSHRVLGVSYELPLGPGHVLLELAGAARPDARELADLRAITREVLGVGIVLRVRSVWESDSQE